MNRWAAGKKIDETFLTDKEAFYRCAKRVFKYLRNNCLGDNDDLYVQSDTLLLADVFEHFKNMCLKTYEPDPSHFLSAPGLAWETCLKKTKIKLELLTDIDMLLMVEKWISGGICHAINRYANENNIINDKLQ